MTAVIERFADDTQREFVSGRVVVSMSFDVSVSGQTLQRESHWPLESTELIPGIIGGTDKGYYRVGWVTESDQQVLPQVQTADSQEQVVSLVSLEGALPGKQRLLVPLPVRVWRESEEYVAEQPTFRIIAFGETRSDVLERLREALVDHRDRLDQLGDKVSTRIRQDRDALRAVVIPDA